ncbi:hypothetical protein KY362_07765 [Candidatus Woesearchaeota archaeon]|nr:hypothetical protein [Candidatus Woesearchaeota archaeon]
MGEDLSNKTLAILLGISVIISLGGMLVFLSKGGDEITGAAMSPTALARINITTRASINWTVYFVDWGTGYVNETAQFCILNTEGENNPDNCSNFTTVYEGLRLENDGNRVVSVNLTSNVTGDTFLGGTEPYFQWKMGENESNVCGNPQGNNCLINVTALQYTTYTNVSVSPVEICKCMNFRNQNDTINVELAVKVPSDSYTGVREATITAWATVI